MALLIETGEHTAIPLQALRSHEVLLLDIELVKARQTYHGRVQWLIEVRDGALHFLRSFLSLESLPFNPAPRRQRHTDRIA